MKLLLSLSSVILVLAAATFGAQHHENHNIAPLFEGMGTHSHPVTTRSALAQRYFNQGLIFVYAFNHAEAVRSFREAARLDPGCAMAHWGAALALGPNINAAMSEEAAKEAFEAVQRAVELSGAANEQERAYIEALSRRYVKHPAADRKALDESYAAAMRQLAKRYPDDPDAVTLFAEALMDTMPWDYWTKDGKAKPATLEILAALESALARDPLHPGANHFYIHAVEASPNPEKALKSADRLRDLVPAAGHLVHMPAHIYMRVGRYHDATIANERAIASDRTYTTQCHAKGLYPVAYVPHNHHFLWASVTMEGRSAKALETARYMASHIDTKLLREPGYGTIQHYLVTPLYAMVRFGKWDEILREPAPDKDLLYPTAVKHYADGLAFAKKGRFKEAERELESLTRIAQDRSLESVTIWDINTTASLVKVAREVLAGELAFEQGDYKKAVTRLKEGVRLERELRYDEPPPWHSPVRHSLGGVLLAAGLANEAEKVFLEDLRRNPENGWSLYGLSLSLTAQGKKKSAAEANRRFEKAWAHSDVKLSDLWLWKGSAEKSAEKSARPRTPARESEPRPASVPVIKSVQLANRVKLEYVELGDQAAVPVIMLHGITDSWRSFELVLPHLPASIHAFALSQRGHGQSDRPRTGYNPRDFAADVAAFMDARNINRAVIVGHSMGSHIAQRFALDYPDRTLGLVLVGSFFTLRGKPIVAEFRNEVSKLTDPIEQRFALEFQQSTLAKPVPESYLESVVQESLKAPARVWRAALEGLLEDDHSAALGRITIPTLIVWGDRDVFCPRRDQESLAAAIAGSRLLIYTGGGHAVHWEEPDRFAADLVEFIARLVN